MHSRKIKTAVCLAAAMSLAASAALAQMGRTWPSEKKIVPDPVTGLPLVFLTSTDVYHQSKIYQTHQQWTVDGKWLIFRGQRETGSQAFAVNEETGLIVQVTETGYSGMLCLAHKSMKLYVAEGGPGGGRGPGGAPGEAGRAGRGPDQPAGAPPDAQGAGGRGRGGAEGAGRGAGAPPDAQGRGGRGPRPPSGPKRILEIDLAKLFADVADGTVKPAANYQRVCGIVPATLPFDGDMGVDANDDFLYFRVNGPETEKLSEGLTLLPGFGPRARQSTSGLRSMNLQTGEIKMIVNVGFQIGHVQTNQWVPGEIVFAWETTGKAPQRTWYIKSDGTGLRPLYPEAPYEWITHEAVIGKDEAVIAMIGNDRVSMAKPDPGWGPAGTFEHPTGVAIVNLRTGAMRIVGQIPTWSKGRSDWHVAGSSDGRWAASDDFQFEVWLYDRHNGEMNLLAGPQNPGTDHIHPTFNADGTKIEIQSALISQDKRSLNICVVNLPKAFLNRTYSLKVPD
jgi:oligogalacturonide lyase